MALDLRDDGPSRRVGNQLAKALLVNTSTGISYPVMYNPNELTLEEGNNFAEVGIPGRRASPIQYVRGKARTLAMELFFDSYEIGTDVRTFTAPIVGLLEKDPTTQAPPILLFSMGRFQFRSVLVEAGQRFTMFIADGTPVRATLTVRLQEFVEIALEIERGVFLGSPTVSAVGNSVARVVTGGAGVSGGPRTHITAAGDTLQGLAGVYLGDPGRWREIADANAIADPLVLTPARSLLIPPADRPRGAGGDT